MTLLLLLLLLLFVFGIVGGLTIHPILFALLAVFVIVAFAAHASGRFW